MFHLQLDQVCFQYPQKGGFALENIQFSLQESGSVALIGASGSGKSTLLRLCAGFEQPQSGDVLCEEKSLRDPDVLESFRQRVGYMPQSASLFPHMTLAENATLRLIHAGWSEKRRKERLETLFDWVRMPLSLQNRYPHEISGGQAQRVSLMRALSHDPECLLLDEPFSALDPVARAGIQSDVLDLVKELSKSLIVVTHDLAEAYFLADDALFLQNGKVIEQGNVENLIRRPKEQALQTFVASQRRLPS